MRWPGRFRSFDVFQGDRRVEVADFSPAGLGLVLAHEIAHVARGNELELDLRRDRIPFARVRLEVTHVITAEEGARVGGRVVETAVLAPGCGEQIESVEEHAIRIGDPMLKTLVLSRLGMLATEARLWSPEGGASRRVVVSRGAAPHHFTVSAPDGMQLAEGMAVIELTLLDALFRIRAPLQRASEGWQFGEPLELSSVVRRRAQRALVPPGRASVEWRHPLDPSRRVTAGIRDISPGGLSIDPPDDPSWLLPPPGKPLRFRLGEHAFPISLEVQRLASAHDTSIGLRLSSQNPEDGLQLARAYQHARWPNLILRAEADSTRVDELMEASGYASLRDGARPSLGWHAPPGDERLTLDLVCRNTDGILHGHVSSLRAYDSTWIYHQLATLPAGRAQAAYPLYALIAEWVLALSRGNGFAIAYFDQSKRWHETMFADFVRWTRSDSLSTIASLDRLEAGGSDLDAPDLHPAVRVRLALPAELPAAAALARRSLPRLTSDALDIHERNLNTDVLCQAHAEAGVGRTRTTLVLERQGDLKGIALCETGSRQLSLFNILNMAFVFFEGGSPPDAREQAALLLAVRRFYERRGVGDPIVVVPTGMLGANQIAGLSIVESMGLWAVSGAGLAQWRNYIQVQLGFRAVTELPRVGAAHGTGNITHENAGPKGAKQ